MPAKQIPTTITLTEDHTLLWENMKVAAEQTRINLKRLNLEAANLAARANELTKQAKEAGEAWAATKAAWGDRQNRTIEVIRKAHKAEVPYAALASRGEDGRFTLTWNAAPKKKRAKKKKKKVAKKRKKKTTKKAKKKVAKKRAKKRA